MAAIIYSKQQLIERVKKHLSDGFPKSSFPVTDNECLLYIDAAIPFVMKGQMFEGAKVSGMFEIPTAYLVTYALATLTRSLVTGEWYAALPQTPIELPTGYDITDAYFSQNGVRSKSVLPLTTKRNTFRDYLPKPGGAFFRVEGQTIYFKVNDGSSLLQYSAYVQMPISRTADKDAAMNLPDGAIEPIFQKVVATILQRYGIPQDIVKDDLPAGVKTS